MANSVAIGDLTYTIHASANDEMRDLMDALNRMSCNLRATARVADEIARGNLSVETKPLSDRDTLGLALQTMLEQLRRVHGRLRLIEFAVDHAAEAVLLLSRDGRVVYGNTAATTLFQRPPAGNPIWALGAGVESSDWMDHWRKLAEGERVALSVDIRRPDGSIIPVAVTANYLAFGDEEFEVSIIRDVTEQLRHDCDMRQALATSQALSNALAGKNEELARLAEILAHHMKEPVRHQHIFAQRLVRQLPQPLAPDVAETITCIIDGASRHLAMLRDAQRYLSVNQPTTMARWVSGEEGLDRAVKRLADRMQAYGAILLRQPLPDLPIDPTALADVLEALIENAIAYSRPGVPPQVSIAGDNCDGEVVISITDNGVGIPPEFRTRVFRMFERLEPRPELPGTGIGLALAKKIVESYGGRIWIEQPAEWGTQVRVAFPCNGRQPGPVRTMTSDDVLLAGLARHRPEPVPAGDGAPPW